MRQQLVMGNWKMNGSRASIRVLLDEMVRDCPVASTAAAEVVVFPPAIYIPEVSDYLKKSAIKWGAQTVYHENSGAYTGELSAPMLKEYGCTYVLVGHSERRTLFNENEKCVAKKFHRVKEHDMIPVLCVGETAAERDQGLTLSVLETQLQAIFRDGPGDFDGCVVAYEPVWAIGTGQTATPDDAAKVQASIRALIAKHAPERADTLPIVYGGSVNEKTAAALFAMPDIDGGLVGGASLNAKQFLDIVTCIKCF
ncbi:MAG: triose-phosphate isomerase [Gammaproteobacteria bacterium]|nr:triose-phosphate isomerase [Gammaproteobacteria bacterium]MCH9763857.1 triose-phosphate isomerase [Gammaproteobacteria bacterium]